MKLNRKKQPDTNNASCSGDDKGCKICKLSPILGSNYNITSYFRSLRCPDILTFFRDLAFTQDGAFACMYSRNSSVYWKFYDEFRNLVLNRGETYLKLLIAVMWMCYMEIRIKKHILRTISKCLARNRNDSIIQLSMRSTVTENMMS